MSETAIAKDLRDYLQLRGHTVWRNQSGQIRKGSHMIRFGTIGSPDIVGFTRQGRAIMVEVKRPGGKRTLEQVQFAENAINCQCIYVLAESVDDLVKAGL